MRPTGGICQRACLDFFSQFDIMLLRSNAEGAVRVESRGEVLNQFLVEVFGQILKAEAACLAGKDLSLRELHLIDAVCRAVDQGGDNRSTAIAAALAVTSFVMIPLHAYSISAVTGVLRAGGDVAWSAALDIAPQWLVALPLTALFALVFKSNYWLVAAAIQAESLLKGPLCALRIRTGKWIHDVTLPQGEL